MYKKHRIPKFAAYLRHQTFNIGRFFNILVLFLMFALMFAFSFSGLIYATDVTNIDGRYGFGRIGLATIVLATAYSIIRSHVFKRTSPLLHVVFIWLVWMSISALLFSAGGIESILFYFIRTWYCPLFFVFFYAQNKYQPSIFGFVNLGMILLMIFNAGLFFSIFQTASRMRFAHLNHVFYVLLLLPFVFSFHGKIFRWIGIAVVSIAAFISMKRSAFFCVIASSGAFFVVNTYIQRGVRRAGAFIALALFALFLPWLIFEIDDYSGGHLFGRLSRITTDQGSGRLEIYKGVLQLQGRASVFGWIFGYGHYAVAPALGYGEHHSAHNDWQEVLYDYGIIGFTIYLAFHYWLIMMIRGLIKIRHPLAPATAASYVIFLILSSVSHLVIYPTYFSYLMAFWGMICAQYERGAAMCRIGTWKRRTFSVSKSAGVV